MTRYAPAGGDGGRKPFPHLIAPRVCRTTATRRQGKAPGGGEASTGALAFPGALGGGSGGTPAHIIKQRGADGRKVSAPPSPAPKGLSKATMKLRLA